MKSPTLSLRPLRVFEGTRLDEVLQDDARIGVELPVAIRSAVGADRELLERVTATYVQLGFRRGDGLYQGVRSPLRSALLEEVDSGRRRARLALLLAVVPHAPAYDGQFVVETARPLPSGDVEAA